MRRTSSKPADSDTLVRLLKASRARMFASAAKYRPDFGLDASEAGFVLVWRSSHSMQSMRELGKHLHFINRKDQLHSHAEEFGRLFVENRTIAGKQKRETVSDASVEDEDGESLQIEGLFIARCPAGRA